MSEPLPDRPRVEHRECPEDRDVADGHREQRDPHI
jgi:hypothetical protein